MFSKKELSTIKADLLLIESQKQEFTPISELKQIKTLLNTLELRLHNFQQVLPRLNRRRGLMNFGGTILKLVFGTATIHDINSLHETLNGLQASTSDIVHSLSNLITYVKKLDTVTRVNNIAIVNLSNIVKNDIIPSHNRFQEIARDILWLNVTLFNPYPTAFPYGNCMVLHFYQQQESSTTKTVHKVINKGLKTYV